LIDIVQRIIHEAVAGSDIFIAHGQRTIYHEAVENVLIVIRAVVGVKISEELDLVAVFKRNESAGSNIRIVIFFIP
jgi:hypothetical protein